MRSFFTDFPHIRLVESDDTAASARLIRQQQIPHRAAIASSLAAEMYGLDTLAANIETNPHNFTRFLIVGDHSSRPDFSADIQQVDKSSLVFTLPHESGSLSKILSMLSYFNLNLTKIQSLPVVGREWEYLFYVDFTFNDLKLYQSAIGAIRPLCHQLEILGEYQTHERRTLAQTETNQQLI